MTGMGNLVRTKLSRFVERGRFLSLIGLVEARISSFLAGYCALAEEIFYSRHVPSPGRYRHASLIPVPFPPRGPATAHRSLAHHDLLQRHLVHVVDRAGHSAVSAVLGDDRSPDEQSDIRGLCSESAPHGASLMRATGLMRSHSA